MLSAAELRGYVTEAKSLTPKARDGLKEELRHRSTYGDRPGSCPIIAYQADDRFQDL